MSLSLSERKSVFAIATLFLIRMAGLFMLLPVFALYSSGLVGVTPQLMGVALGIHGISQALLQVPFGMLSDYVGRKPVVLAGALVFVLGSLIGMYAEDIYTMIFARFLQGAGAISSVMMALLADLTSDENRTQAMAMVGGAIGVSFALAMVLGPIVASYGGLSAVLEGTFVSGVIALFIIAWVLPSPKERKIQREHGTVVSELGRVAFHPSLVTLNVGVMILHTTMMACFVALPTVMVTSLGIPREQHGYWYLPVLVLAFIAVIPLIIVAEKKRRMKSAFLVATITLSLSLLLMTQAGHGRWWLVMSLFGYFWAFNMLEASLPSWVSKVSPAGSRGTAMGVYASAQFLGVFIGGALGGYFIGHRGPEAVFVLMGCLGLVWTLLVLKSEGPRYLTNTSVILPVDAMMRDAFAAELSDVRGVADVAVVAEDNRAYIKIDRQAFDSAVAEDLLARYGVHQQLP